MLLPLVGFAAFILVWQSSLLGTPTAEAALFLGVFLAPLTLLAGACRGALRNPRGVTDDLLKEGVWVIGTVGIYLLGLSLHSMGYRSCSPSAGIWPFLILIVPQLFLNLITGIWIGRLVGRIKLAVIFTLILAIVYMVIQVSLWWMNPSLRFFEPYWLLVAGDLLQGQSLDSGVITYRISSLFIGLGLWALGIHWKQHARKFWMVLLLISAGLLLQWKSSNMIAPPFSERKEAYPDVVTQGSLILHTNLEMIGKNSARAILQEGALWLQRLQNRTGIESHQPIHIWLYSNQESLAHFTGAKNVHFTLPSHREIHITGTEIPHPTLGHELAHIVLGQVSDTLWGTPGILGLLPNWGLSEGLATYLTPELAIREDLSIQEQAYALYRLGLEKHPEDLLSPDLWSFWMQSSVRAYTASASILGAYLDRQCRTLICRSKWIKKMARMGEVSLPIEFLKAYRLKMEQEPLPPDALPSVVKRFGASSILFSDCSKTAKQKNKTTPEQEGDTLGLQKRFNEAMAKYDQIQALELPIYEQRQLMIKKAFLKDVPYALAGFHLLVSKPQEGISIAAAWGFLGASLSKPVVSDIAYDYAAYILARAEILGGNFNFGLAWMPQNLDGLLGQESKKLSALAKSQIGQAEQAAVEFNLLKNQATRPADKLRFADMAERASQIAVGQSFLLGVYAKVIDDANLSRF
jgi:hypothetical protein